MATWAKGISNNLTLLWFFRFSSYVPKSYYHIAAPLRFRLPGGKSQHVPFVKPVSHRSLRWMRQAPLIRRYTHRPFLVKLLPRFLCSIMKAMFLCFIMRAMTSLDSGWDPISLLLKSVWAYHAYFILGSLCLPLHFADSARSMLPVQQLWTWGASSKLPCLQVAVGALVLPWSSWEPVDMCALQGYAYDVSPLSLIWNWNTRAMVWTLLFFYSLE